MLKLNGRSISETLYMQGASGSQISYIGAVNSSSSVKEFVDFILNNSLSIEYMETFTYYNETQVITGIETSVFDSEGNVSVSTLKYSVTIKEKYYILEVAEDPA